MPLEGLASSQISCLCMCSAKFTNSHSISKQLDSKLMRSLHRSSLLSGSLCGTIVIHDTQQQLTVKQTCPAICKIRPCSQTKASISRLQWYPHDTGIFTSSGSDSHLKIWDTNSLTVVEQFRFRGRVNFHTMGRNSTHCLIAGILLCFVYMVYAHAVYVGDNFHRACSENLVVICDFISQMTSPNYCRCGFFACLKFC